MSLRLFRLSGAWLLLAATWSAPAVAQTGTGSVSGVITDQATAQPLEVVQVYLDGTQYNTITQPNGRSSWSTFLRARTRWWRSGSVTRRTVRRAWS